MASFGMQDMEEEIGLAFGNGKTACSVKVEIQELNQSMEGGAGDVFLKISKAIALLSSITGYNSFPVHQFTISFSVLSNILQKLGTQLKASTPQVEEDKVYSALLRYQDSELRSEAVGVEDLLFNAHAYLKEIDEEAHESVVVKLEDRFPNDDTVRFLGKLKAKAYELLTNSDRESAHRASVYINLYFRLAILRTLVLWQVFCIKQRSGHDKASTQGVLAMLSESKNSDMEVVRYVTETNHQKAVFLTVFHPTENDNFVNFLRIHQIKIPCIGQNKHFFYPTRYICSSRSPEIKLEMSSWYKGRIWGSKSKSAACEFKLEPVEKLNMDNIFFLRSKKWSDHYVYMEEGGKCFSVSGQPGPEGQWKVVQFENDGSPPKYMMSPVKWPCQFLVVRSFLWIVSIEGTKNLKKIKDRGSWDILDVKDSWFSLT